MYSVINKLISISDRVVSFTIVGFVTLLIILGLVFTSIKIEKTVTLTGNIEPKTIAKITSELQGKIINVNKFHDNKVAKGDVIITLDTIQNSIQRKNLTLTMKSLRLKREQHLLQFERQKENLTHQIELLKIQYAQKNELKLRLTEEYKDNLNFYRIKDLSYEISEIKERKNDFERQLKDNKIYLKDVEAIDIQIETTNLELYKFQSEYQKSFIKAPFDGWLITDINEKLIGKFCMIGEELLLISPDQKKWEVKFSAQENDIKYLKPDQMVKIYFSAYSFMKYDTQLGQLTEVTNIPSGSSNMYTIKASFNNDNLYQLKTGFSVTGKVIVKEDYIFNILLDDFTQNYSEPIL